MFLKSPRRQVGRFINAERTGRDGVFIGTSNFAVASVVSEVTGETQRRGGTQRIFGQNLIAGSPRRASPHRIAPYCCASLLILTVRSTSCFSPARTVTEIIPDS